MASAVEGSGRIPKQARRSQPISVYKVDNTTHPSLKLDQVNLKQLPENFVSVDSTSRPNAVLSSRQLSTNDFYECRNSNPAPSDSDCNTIIDNVLALDLSLTVTASSCLQFQYGTCWGFFCSLCDTLTTDTGFVGNQLISAEALCVAGGQIGTIISQDAPEWQAGFVYEGASLPNYDVC
ncbi:hypothetical protein M426DRAFT_58349 [Hypoxylon sp. CI-4A]|nr:hypothetical protein M426DRAFT_58349 [Hypoxylon sp. CI-4A]